MKFLFWIVPLTILSQSQADKLFTAVYNKDVKAVRAIVKKGTNPDIVNAQGFTPLHELMARLQYSISNEEKEIFFLLLEAGADINKHAENPYKGTALEFAALSCVPQAVQLLLDHDASIKNSFPLHKACFKKCVSCAKILVENGADVNARDASGLSALQLLLKYSGSDEKALEILQLLHSKGASLSEITTDGETLLDLAEKSELKKTSAYLIQQGITRKEKPSSVTAGSRHHNAQNPRQVELSLSRPYSNKDYDAVIEVSRGEYISLYADNALQYRFTVVKSYYTTIDGAKAAVFEVQKNPENIDAIIFIQVPNMTIMSNGYPLPVTGYNRVVFANQNTYVVMDAKF